MARLRLEQWETRPYGYGADGVVEAANGNINIRWRRPAQGVEPSGFLYVNANGLTAGKNSMRVPAIEATRFGHESVTVEYTNRRSQDALNSNVRDIATVTDALPSYLRRAFLGLSMGGAVVTKALNQVETPVDLATLVASGGYILPEFYTRFEIAKRFIAEMHEISQIPRNPRVAIALGFTSVGNCARRPRAVKGELHELLHDIVHDDLRQAKAQPNAPYVRFMPALGDDLLPAGPQLASVVGLPFDDVVPFEGAHARLAYDPTLADDIFTMDAQLFSPIPLLKASL